MRQAYEKTASNVRSAWAKEQSDDREMNRRADASDARAVASVRAFVRGFKKGGRKGGRMSGRTR
jgi:hypothetical protein